MKKILLKIAIAFCGSMICARAFAQSNFSGIDMVKFDSLSKSGYIEYNIGEDSGYQKTKRFLNPFYMNRYETTYELWYLVRVWGGSHGYTFKNLGQEGSEGIRGRSPSPYFKYQPVTSISWYDAIVWCNALSEIYGYTPCYTYDGEVLRNSNDTAICDLANCDWTANGFRHPSEAEWEYAARKTSSGVQRGDLASGQVNQKGQSDPSIPAEEVCWFCDNAEETHVVGTAGTPFAIESEPAPGSGNPNGAGLFDMSGNVLEYCWDWYSSVYYNRKATPDYGPKFAAERVMRGGSYSLYSLFIFAGDRYSFDPNENYEYQGFRLARTVSDKAPVVDPSFNP